MSEGAALLLLLAHCAATLFMTGLIWVVQFVHYPLFARVGDAAHEPYQHAHMIRITWIVAPMMILELGTALALIFWRPDAIEPSLALTGLIMVLLIWLSTAALQAPAHQRLARGFDARVHQLLVRTNWIRTLLWTARSGLVLTMLWEAGLR